MRMPHLLIIALIVIAGAVHAADVPKGYDAFRFVKSRNIFDPDRRAMRTETPSTRPAPQPRASFISVTGTMVADGKTLVFFSGSSAEYSKVVSIGDTIADFKVTGITNAQVELDRAGKQVVVAVGKQVPLEGSIAATTASVAPPSEAAAAPPGDAPAPDAAAPSDAKPGSEPVEGKPASTAADEPNEVLRRMMERRQKEMSK